MPWNDDMSYAMTPCKFFTLPIGGWPLQQYNIFALVRYIMSCCGMSVELILSYLNIYYNCNDIYEQIDTLMILVCTILGLVKLSMYRIYADNLTRNFSSAVSDYLAIDTEEKRTIMRRHAFMGRIIFYCTVIFGYVVSFGLMVTPIMASNKDVNISMNINVSINNYVQEYPIPATCTLGHFYFSTRLYVTIFIVQCIVVLATTSSNLGNDSLFLAIALHVCGQMELLRIEFSDFGMESKNIKQDFLKLTTRHCYLLNHIKLLADAVSLVLIVQLLISGILICVIGFQFIVALKVGDIVMITKTTMALIVFLLQLFAYSAVGDYLKNQTEEIAHSVYFCNWHCLSLKMMKNILFIIMRSQQPVSFRAGQYLIVNLETYMSILKTSFSYLSVLRVMIDT